MSPISAFHTKLTCIKRPRLKTVLDLSQKNLPDYKTGYFLKVTSPA